MADRQLPNFLYIGPPKSGSSWLYEVLRQHPKVFVPTLKDIYFFDRYYNRGLDWYAGYFAPSTDVTARGEICHDYLYSDEACERIAGDLPGVKLITILRDPVERAVSHYRYSLRFGNVKGTFEEACEQNPLIMECGRYGKHLKRYFERFPSEDLGVFYFDDLKRDARGLAEQVLGFLGCEADPDFEYDQRVNSKAGARSVALTKLAKRGAHLARDLGAGTLVGVLKRNALVRSLLFDKHRAADAESVSEAQRAACREAYAEDTAELTRLLGTPPAWAQTPTPATP